jgi:tripeptide aminopeptidase
MGTLKAGPPDVASIAELAQMPGVRECLQWVVREKQWINEQHLQVCRIAAPTFLEGKRAEWMIAQFRSLGYDARLDRAGNVVAQNEPNFRGPVIALTAHLDTVLAPRTAEDIKMMPDGTIRGPGVADNGAGLAGLLAVAHALKSAPRVETANSILFVANVGEEGEGNLSGMRYLCRQSALASRIRAFIVLDGPTTDHITRQALASRRFEVSYSGPGGHSWSDFGIGNPVHALSRAISFFVDDPLTQSTSPRVSFNFGTIQGGSSINSIPTDARSKVDIRSESAARIEELVELLTSCVDRSLRFENERSTGGRVSARLKEVGSRPGGRLPDDSAILRSIRAVDAHLGIKSHLDCASTDANIPLSMGLPAISIGAGGQGAGAHTPNEWFHPDGRETGLKRVLLVLFSLLLEQ